MIVAVAIPTSLITAFGTMWLLGYTLNLMTLLAMSLVIGVLVDDATVVLENIQRHLDMGKTNEKPQWMDEWKLVILLCLSLWWMWWFCPILFYIFFFFFVADMLKQFSVVIIVTVLTSLLVGFTLTPWLASRIGEKENLQPTNFFQPFFTLV